MGPTQLNIPRDFFYGDIECEIPRPLAIERGAGGEKSLDEAAELLAAREVPGDPRRRRRRHGATAQAEAIALAELLQAPVAQQLPAQRLVPGEPPAVVRPARLPGLARRR